MNNTEYASSFIIVIINNSNTKSTKTKKYQKRSYHKPIQVWFYPSFQFKIRQYLVHFFCFQADKRNCIYL